MTRRRTTNAGEILAKHTKENIQPLESVDSDIESEFADRYLSDTLICSTARESEVDDQFLGPIIEELLSFSNVSRPFKYATVDWKDIDFCDLALHDRASSDVIVIKNTDIELDEVFFYRGLEVHDTNLIAEFLNKYEPPSGKKRPGWHTILYLVQNQAFEKHGLLENQFYLITGALVKHGSYFVPAVRYKDGKIVVTLFNLKNRIIAHEMKTFTV